MDKYSVFIDGGYLRKVLKLRFNRQPIDFVKLSDYFAQGDTRHCTYYYDCPPFMPKFPTVEDKQRLANFNRFHDKLVRLPKFQVRLGKLRSNDDGTYEQKMVDIYLAVDLLKLSIHKVIQRAVLITNDRDFVPAIKAARDEDVVIEICRDNSVRHDALVSQCTACIDIDQNLINGIRLSIS